MNLTLQRYLSNDQCTIGELSIKGVFECYTLEDIVREMDAPVEQWKIHGSTAIPSGTYEIKITPSIRFGTALPVLLNVPGFSGIRIHAGNTAADTEGCILVGTTKSENSCAISHSRDALKILQGKIAHALEAGEQVFVNVING